MSPTTRRVMFWGGIVLVLGLSLGLAFLTYCDYRARHPQDVVGQYWRIKPEWTARPAEFAQAQNASTLEHPPELYDLVDRIGVSEVHRIGAQGFYVAKVPLIALILVGLLLIWRARYQPRATTPVPPSDPLAD